MPLRRLKWSTVTSPLRFVYIYTREPFITPNIFISYLFGVFDFSAFCFALTASIVDFGRNRQFLSLAGALSFFLGALLVVGSMNPGWAWARLRRTSAGRRPTDTVGIRFTLSRLPLFSAEKGQRDELASSGKGGIISGVEFYAKIRTGVLFQKALSGLLLA